jgi:hypothetical protein
VRADLDALLTAIYVLVDDFLPARVGPGAPPRITDAELITLAIAQVFLGLPNDRQFLALARWRLGHLFPYPPKQPGYNKRLRLLGPQIARSINTWPSSRRRSATVSGCSTRPRCRAASRARPHAARSLPASPATVIAARTPLLLGFRLYLLCATDGTPIAFELAPANAPEREVAKEMLERVPLAGYVVVADKGFAGGDFEAFMESTGARFLRPDRKDEHARFGSLGHIRQWIESVFWTCKGQLGLERHGARTLPGLCARIGLRLLTLAAGLWHNWEIGQPGRRFSAYTH